MKRGASVVVRLLANADHLDAALDSICRDAFAAIDAAEAASRSKAAAVRRQAEAERAQVLARISVLRNKLRHIEDSLIAIRTMEERGGYAYFDHPTYKAAERELEAARAAANAPLPSGTAGPTAELAEIRVDAFTDMRVMLDRYQMRQVKTGIDAHYYLSDVGPGAYYLHAQTSIFDQSYDWFARVAVSGQEEMTLDLDNDALDAGRLSCGLR